MPVTLSKPAPQWHTITLSSDVTMQIGVCNPSWSAATKDLAENLYDGKETPAERLLARLRAVVVDWADVLGDDGKPVTFSWGGLESLGTQYPGLIFELTKLANRLFNQSAETSPKN